MVVQFVVPRTEFQPYVMVFLAEDVVIVFFHPGLPCAVVRVFMLECLSSMTIAIK